MKTTADESEDAFSGMTVPLEVEVSDTIKQAVISYSQKHYGTPKKEVEEYMEALFVTDKTDDRGKTSTATKSKSTRTKNLKKVHGA
jgi:hypothetical protein